MKEMKVGETLTFPKQRTAYIRYLAYSLGFEMDRTYKVSTDRFTGTISVELIKA